MVVSVVASHQLWAGRAVLLGAVLVLQDGGFAQKVRHPSQGVPAGPAVSSSVCASDSLQLRGFLNDTCGPSVVLMRVVYNVLT